MKSLLSARLSRGLGQLGALALLAAPFTVAPHAAAQQTTSSISPGDLVISEFRLRGPTGPQDEYIEIYNTTTSPITVQTADLSSGFAVRSGNTATSNTVFVIPNGVIIPAHGHYLGANSVKYALGSYATPDITWTTDIADNQGLAIFQSSTTFDSTTRLDAAGFTTSPALYKEGNGIPTVQSYPIDASFYRFHLKSPATAGISDPAIAMTDGEPRDTGDNLSDFAWVDTNGTSAGAGQRLGAPGPKNLSSPIAAHAATRNLTRAYLDTAVALNAAPNFVRNTTSDYANNAGNGYLEFNRTFTNDTGAPLTRLRFRVVKLTTFPAPSGFADLRPFTSASGTISTAGGTVTVNGTTLEQDPQQPNGGGWNSSFSVPAVSVATPLAIGASINVRFRYGIQQTGTYRFALLGEALPSVAHLWFITGDTENASAEIEDGISNPVIDSSLTASATYGTSFSYTVTASANPTGYSASGFPAGLSFDTATGILSGTPTATGPFNVTIGASNGLGSDSKTLVLTVAKKGLTVTGVTALNRFYNGGTLATLDTSSALLSGVYNNESIALDTTGAVASFASPNAGGTQTVTVAGLALAGSAAGNYTLTQPTASASINAVALTVTANSGQSKIEGNLDPTFTYSLSSGAFVGVDGFSGALGRQAGETTGSYAINQGSLSASSNYSVTFVPANFTINAANTAPVASAQSVNANEDAAKAITLQASDADSNPLTYSIVTPPAHGALTGSGASRTYTPAANYNGADSFTFKVNDGTVDSSVVTVSIAIAAVNDKPAFVSGGDQSIAQDAGAQTVIGWATSISAGPLDEAAQTVSFTASADKPELFTAAPAISASGTLTYTPAPNAKGTAIVTVTAHDSGGTANGGVDASAPITFKIAVTTYEDALGNFNGLAKAAPLTTASDASAGVIKVKIAAKGIFTGSLKLAGTSFTLRGRFDKAGVGHFGQTDATSFTLARKGATPLDLTLQLDLASSDDRISGVITDASAPFAVVTAERALYTASKRPKAPLITTPASLPGRYTVALNTVEGTLLASQYPQGDGVGVLTVSTNGTARLTGTLADGTPFSSSNSISVNNTWPLYASFPKGKGSISGPLTFEDVPSTSDVDGSEIKWFKAADATAERYPAGWPQGLTPSLVGCKFTLPKAIEKRSVLSGMPPISLTGNAEFTLANGNLLTPIVKDVNVSAANLVTVATPAADKLALRLRIYDLRPSSPNYKELVNAVGLMEGSFVDPVTKAVTTFKGVVLQKQRLGTGFFLGATEGGSVMLEPKAN